MKFLTIRHIPLIVLLAFCTWLLTLNASAQTEKFCIAKDGKAATIIVDENDWKGVIRAANDLGDDVRKVTGVAAPVQSVAIQSQPTITIGTIGKSRLIDRLIKQKKLDVKKSRATGRVTSSTWWMAISSLRETTSAAPSTASMRYPVV